MEGGEVAADFPDLGWLVVEEDEGLPAARRPGQDLGGRVQHAVDRLVEEEPEQRPGGDVPEGDVEEM